VRWGVTSREAVLHGLRVLSLCRVRCMGVVISRVELRRFHGYSAHPSYTPAVG
jgi:hypothetical protein